jgi:hypothetical protein
VNQFFIVSMTTQVHTFSKTFTKKKAELLIASLFSSYLPAGFRGRKWHLSLTKNNARVSLFFGDVEPVNAPIGVKARGEGCFSRNFRRG